MIKLKDRNAENIPEETERPEIWSAPLERPMSARERKRRERIRRKAVGMAFDLVLAYWAGVLPFRNLPRTAKELVEGIEIETMVSMQERSKPTR
jgi:hypothetical protein